MLEDMWNSPLVIVQPLVMSILAGLVIRRFERIVSPFYWALKKKYPRSYVKQNKTVKVIRKCQGMETRNDIHWLFCVFHHLQLVMIVSPILRPILPLVLPTDAAIVTYYAIGLGPFGVIALVGSGSSFVQAVRCQRIKKKDPRYARTDLYHW